MQQVRGRMLLCPKVFEGTGLLPGGDFTLLGCTVALGFDCTDHEVGKRDELLYLYPGHEDMIRALTRT